MAGFSKRPHRHYNSGPDKEKLFGAPEEKENNTDAGAESYINASFFDSDDDNDDLPDPAVYKKTRNRRQKLVYSEDDEFSSKPKKPNIFVRAVHAIFPMKGDGVAESVRKVVFDIAVVAFIITGGSVVLDLVSEKIQVEIVDKALIDTREKTVGKSDAEIIGSLSIPDDEIEAIQQEKPGIQASFIEFYSQNSDIVGWISVGDENEMVIDYPVVQAADNDYYLTHNFLRQEVKRGAIFADYKNKFDGGQLSANTILYGHNMYDGDTMFAKLSRYYDGGVPKGETTDYLAFYKKHPTVTFDTLYENSKWKVFACVLFNTQEELGEVYPYINKRDFSGKDDFNSFILDIMDRSSIWTDVDVDYGDNILTLSTCYYPYGKENADTRVAVFARKVRPGESADVDITKAMRNPDPLKFAYQYRVEGGSWGGRKWDSSKLLSL